CAHSSWGRLAGRAPERGERGDAGAGEFFDLTPVEPCDPGEMIDGVPPRIAERFVVADRAVVDGQRLSLGLDGYETFEPRADAPIVGAELVRAERHLLARSK